MPLSEDLTLASPTMNLRKANSTHSDPHHPVPPGKLLNELGLFQSPGAPCPTSLFSRSTVLSSKRFCSSSSALPRRSASRCFASSSRARFSACCSCPMRASPRWASSSRTSRARLAAARLPSSSWAAFRASSSRCFSAWDRGSGPREGKAWALAIWR